jgi:hypothetical protein
VFRQILARIERLAWHPNVRTLPRADTGSGIIAGSGVSEEGIPQRQSLGTCRVSGFSVATAASVMCCERGEWLGGASWSPFFFALAIGAPFHDPHGESLRALARLTGADEISLKQIARSRRGSSQQREPCSSSPGLREATVRTRAGRQPRQTGPLITGPEIVGSLPEGNYLRGFVCLHGDHRFVKLAHIPGMRFLLRFAHDTLRLQPVTCRRRGVT